MGHGSLLSTAEMEKAEHSANFTCGGETISIEDILVPKSFTYDLILDF
jgi:hypothetical protein